MATVACQTHPRPTNKPCWANRVSSVSSLATANKCFEYTTFSCPSFLLLHNQSICPNPVCHKDNSPPLRSGGNIHRLIHWTQQMTQCVECFEDVQGTSNLGYPGQFQAPCPHFTQHFVVQPGATGGQLWPSEPDGSGFEGEISHLQTVWNGWHYLPSLCLGLLICELKIMLPSLQDHWGH